MPSIIVPETFLHRLARQLGGMAVALSGPWVEADARGGERCLNGVPASCIGRDPELLAGVWIEDKDGWAGEGLDVQPPVATTTTELAG